MSMSKIKLNHNGSSNITRDIAAYFVVMLIAVAIMRYITKNIATVWIINFVGLCFVFFKYIRVASRKILLPIVIYILVCVISILVNAKFLTSDLKGIGTNINLIVFGISGLLIFYFYKYKPFNDELITEIFKIISVLGSISSSFGLITGLSDISRVMSGRLGVYRAQVYGFFFGKNLYGEFVSLSIIAGIYVFTKVRKKTELIFIVVKIVAVVLSFSRAALLQMFVMILVYVLIYNQQYSKIIKCFFGCLCIFAVSMYYLSNTFNSFIISYVIRGNAGDAGRAQAIRNAFYNDYSIFQILLGISYSGIAYYNVDVDNTYVFLYFSGGIIKCLI